MLIQILFSILVGIFFGTLTGLIPGIHINLIAALLITISAKIYLNPIYSIIFITSLAITHTFVDFIPSIFLGCPDTDTELSILPGHQLLKNKRGYEAIYLSNKGSLIAIFMSTLMILPSVMIIPKIYPIIKTIIPYLLIFVIIIMILTEKRKISAFFIIILTGLLGISTNQIELNEPLLPLLTGLFGASNIILSIKNKTIIPEQIITKPKLSLKNPIFASMLSAPLCSFLPGLGSGQAAIIGNSIIKQSKRQFLILVGIINTLVMSFSLITLYTINKTRTGAAVAIKEIFPYLEPKHLILLSITTILVGIIAFKITDYLSKLISKRLQRINYKTLSYSTLILLIIINIIISGFIGLLILVISTLTGIYCINQKVRRTNMMGVLLIPTIIWLI